MPLCVCVSFSLCKISLSPTFQLGRLFTLEPHLNQPNVWISTLSVICTEGRKKIAESTAGIKRELCLGIMKWVAGKHFHIHSLYQVKLQIYEFFQVTCNYSVNVQLKSIICVMDN